MDLRIIVEVFVVVVIGGLGSIIGAFVAAVLVSELNAFGILFPKISIILVFLVMAVVLMVRPWGLFGKPEAAARRTAGGTATGAGEESKRTHGRSTARERGRRGSRRAAGKMRERERAERAMIVRVSARQHNRMAVSRLASFGHAAYFGLGAYGVAFLAKTAGCR